MKKIISVLFALFIFSASIFAVDFDKSIGIDFSFNGLTPNFYMVGNHFELESGLSFTQVNTFSIKNTFTPSVAAGYSSPIGASDKRFAIGFADSLMFGFDSNSFNTGNVLSLYLRLSLPLDNRLEIGGICYIPLSYINISTKAEENANMLCGVELLEYSLTMFAFEVRYYLGGL